jgi:hypothetical protein
MIAIAVTEAESVNLIGSLKIRTLDMMASPVKF